LQRLARHSHVATTMTYYVALGADDVAADLWANHGGNDNNHNTRHNSGQSQIDVSPLVPSGQGRG
ncbi:MAG: hypothetical protein JW888_01360, partial [Pirellulales bacterium]|nr:hypothetical protein [Pirellulales bacterium]